MNENRRTHRIGLVLASLVASWMMALAPAAAEPYPWHSPDANTSGGVARASKAQIEYHERLAAATAVPTLTKAQVERHERLAAEAAAASNSTPASSSPSPRVPWAVLGFLALGAVAVALGIMAIRSLPGLHPIR
jgi:cobalamin biosynthesis Mg chelatase CobN